MLMVTNSISIQFIDLKRRSLLYNTSNNAIQNKQYYLENSLVA